MRKLLLPFLLTFLLFWMFGGALWYASNYKTASKDADKTLTSSPFLFVDGDYEIKAQTNFAFFQSSYDPFIPEQLNSTLYQIGEYCNRFPTKKILVEGRYHENEKNNSAFANLGIARAESIKSRLIRLGLEGTRIITRGHANNELVFDDGVALESVSMKVIQKEPVGDHL